jgi:two-component system OmpR family sensor kinase
MSNERAVDVTEIQPWDAPGDPIDPGAAHEPEQAAADDPIAESRRRRWRFLPRSLSSRLVVFVAGLVIVVVAAAGSVTYAALHSFLLNRVDQQLVDTTDLRSLQAMINLHVGAGLRNPQSVWIAVIDTSGNLIPNQPTSPGIEPLQLPASTRASLVRGTSGPISVATTTGTHLRLVSVTGLAIVGTNQPVTVLVGLSTSEVDRTLHRLFLIEVAIGSLAVALALVLTSWGVHLSLRPLNRVTRTARDVTAELSPDGAGLDRRVPVADPDTEVGQLGESFNTLMGAVETQFAARVESEQRMRQFLADASHELRTPLTSIRGYAELSRMRRANGETEAEDTLDRIESEGTRMSRLVDDLLLLARSDQGAPPQVGPVDVSELIEDAVEGARAAYPSRRIDAVATPGLVVAADHDQLLRVLRNLVTNAAVHTAADGPIRVSAQLEGDEVALRVTDSGPGLPPEEAQHVFERFWRADKARSRVRGGSGLGLAIVASIVQAHGGTVRFDSSLEGGSTVTVRLSATVAAPS